ncbi:MAG: peptidoglycan DD-metalloendopeptidase family protein [Planctomycetes bacterium]|nr:peptidoglycan DD-metalloendopeptidase family protein [Planctomycetota bacterium]
MITRFSLALPLLLLASAAPEAPVLHGTFDLALGEAAEGELPGGKKVRLKLVELKEETDEVNGSVRGAKVKVEVNGETASLSSGNYNLPQTLAGVQVDCPITAGYLKKARKNVWGFHKDARVRVWPEGSPLLPPGSFVYPAKQRWFATFTQMANEPTYVDGGDVPVKKDVYYHYGLDIGGSEGLVDVVAATDGTVVSSGLEVLAGHEKDTPVDKRYDVVYVMDLRGWYYRYSHLKFMEDWVRPGAKVAMGRKIGVLGKEGGSGGWSHLHFDITKRQPSGEWGIEDGYGFIWEAYRRERAPKLMAVARPHHIIWAGSKVTLDGSKSFGSNLQYEWTFTEGGSAAGVRVEHAYEKPGTYSEILKISDDAGRVDYDFQVVLVLDKARPETPAPTIHANYAPTFGIRPADPVLFKVRTFQDKEGGETWDFGDGTPAVGVKSDGNKVMHAPNGYAEALHKYAKAGHYLVKVEHVSADGVKAVARMQVRVGIE